MHVGKKVTKKVSHERFGCSLPTFSVGVLLSMRIDARVTTRRRSLTIQSITFFLNGQVSHIISMMLNWKEI